MAQLAVVLLALFGQMERTYAMERAAHARAVATVKGRRVGRPVLVDPGKLEWAAHLRETGSTIAEIIEKTGIPRTSLYRHLPPRSEPLFGTNLWDAQRPAITEQRKAPNGPFHFQGSGTPQTMRTPLLLRRREPELASSAECRKQAKGAADGAAAECDSWRPAAGWSVDRRDRVA